MNAKDIILARKLGGGGVSEVEWHQCPETVRNYLAYVAEHPYNPNDYTYTYVKNFAPVPAVTANTKPVGKTVDGITYYNEVPNVKTPFASTSEAGTLKPLDRLRWINTPANNVRDLGGWACDGGTVKYGKIIRGGAVTIADREVLVNQLGIRVDLNVYCQGEQLEWTVSPLGADIKFVEARNYNWYDLTDKAAWRVNIGAIFDAVAHNEPLYFHCVQGADRTGTLAVVIEALLGVSQSNIDVDYELTSFYSKRTRVPDSTIPSNLPGLINAIKALGNGDLMDGSVNFAASLGFTAAEINAFRVAMIDGTPKTVTPNISTFTVTNTLSHVATDNESATVTQYQPYKADITPADGYKFDSVAIAMGGENIKPSCYTEIKYPSNVGKISIPAVTGDVVITAIAEATTPSYTNLADPTSADWQDGYRLNSSGNPIAASGKTVCNYIPCAQGDVIYINGTPGFDTSGADRIAILSASKSSLDTQYTNVYLGNPTSTPTGYMRKISEGYYEFHVTSATAAYLRASFDTPSIGIIITINEEIK